MTLMRFGVDSLAFAVTVKYKTVVVQVLDPKECGASARAERKRRGLTMREVAKQMGCSIRYVSVIERGEKRWTYDLAERYSKALVGCK